MDSSLTESRQQADTCTEDISHQHFQPCKLFIPDWERFRLCLFLFLLDFVLLPWAMGFIHVCFEKWNKIWSLHRLFYFENWPHSLCFSCAWLPARLQPLCAVFFSDNIIIILVQQHLWYWPEISCNKLHRFFYACFHFIEFIHLFPTYVRHLTLH